MQIGSDASTWNLTDRGKFDLYKYILVWANVTGLNRVSACKVMKRPCMPCAYCNPCHNGATCAESELFAE